jgi:hypothetical protein
MADDDLPEGTDSQLISARDEHHHSLKRFPPVLMPLGERSLKYFPWPISERFEPVAQRGWYSESLTEKNGTRKDRDGNEVEVTYVIPLGARPQTDDSIDKGVVIKYLRLGREV